jgi:hypothetical protein
VVRIEEVLVNKEEGLNVDKEANREEEGYTEEEASIEEGIEGQEFKHNTEDEI